MTDLYAYPLKPTDPSAVAKGCTKVIAVAFALMVAGVIVAIVTTSVVEEHTLRESSWEIPVLILHIISSLIPLPALLVFCIAVLVLLSIAIRSRKLRAKLDQWKREVEEVRALNEAIGERNRRGRVDD